MTSTLMQNPKSSVEVNHDPKQSVEVAKDSHQSMVKNPPYPSVTKGLTKDPDPTAKADSVVIDPSVGPTRKDPDPKADSVVIDPSVEIGDVDEGLGDVKAGLDCPDARPVAPPVANAEKRGVDIQEVTERTAQMCVRPKNRQPDQQLGLPFLQGADGNEETMAACGGAMPLSPGTRPQASSVGEETKTTSVMKSGKEEFKVTERKRRIRRYDQPAAQNTGPAFHNCQFNAAVITGGNFGDFNQTYQSLPERSERAHEALPLDNNVVTTDHATSLSEEFADLLDCEEQISIDDILDIAEEMGENWIAFGRKLGTKTAGIENIKCRCHYEDLQEMCVLLLEEWLERVSDEATVSKVSHTLINLKLKDSEVVPAILDKLLERRKPVNQ